MCTLAVLVRLMGLIAVLFQRHKLLTLKMSHIENLKAFDPFADAAKGENEGVQDGLVHVRYH
jgi:hypothetical protein